MSVQKKLGYLKGLSDGLDLSPGDTTSRILMAVIDLLEEMSDILIGVQESQKEIRYEIDYLKNKIKALEDAADSYDDQLMELYEGLRVIFTPSSHSLPSPSKKGKATEESKPPEDVYYEVSCPHCGWVITMHENRLALGSVQCPKCKGSVEIEPGSDSEPDSQDR